MNIFKLNFKSILTLFLLSVTIIGFTSCEDNNDSDSSDSLKSTIVGEWEEDWYEDFLTFKADGTGIWSESPDEDEDAAAFKWTCSEDVLTIYFLDDDGDVEISRLYNIQSNSTIIWKHYVDNPQAYASDVLNKDNFGYYYIWKWERCNK